MPKTLADSFLFGKSPEYGRKMVEFIAKAERINTKSSEFADVLFDVKRRRISEALSKIATSDNVVIGINTFSGSLPKAFRTFVAKDIKDGNKYKMFIDGTDFLKYKDGTYDCTDINWLICYLVAGMTNFIYKIAPSRLILDSSIINDGCDCYMRLFSYIVDRIYKTTSVQQLQKRVNYVACMFYLINILGKEFKSESQFRTCHSTACRIANIEDRDASIVDTGLLESDFNNIATIISAYERIFNFRQFKTDVFVSLWMQSFGTGTTFAIEYFPALAMMLSNSYIGGYLDNQLMIEKLTADSMIKFVKSLLRIGEQATKQ